MTVKTETLHAGSFIESEARGTRSRERIIVLSGTAALVAGAVLGRVLAGAAGNAVAFPANTGNGVMGAITVGAAAKLGDYKLVVIEPAANAGVFEVEGPDGIIIGRGNVAALFNVGGLSFTLADGATDFIAGDGFTITVSGGSYKYKDYDNAAVDGSQVAVGVLYDDTDASAADKAGVAIVRDAEVKSAALVWKGTQSAGDKAAGIADLATLGIIAR